MRLITYPQDSLISELLTNGEEMVLGPDCDGFARFLGKCVDTRNYLGPEQRYTWYIQDNIETRIVYDWDYILDYYYPDLKNDRFYMADAFWHQVLLRNGIESYRIMPIIELPTMLKEAVGRWNASRVQYHFTSLINNRNDSRYAVHRHLYHNNYLDQCNWSWNNNQGLTSFFFNNRWLGIRDSEYELFPEQRQNGTIWEPDMGSSALTHHTVSAVTLCYQTIYHGCGPVYDGKVFKCFLSLRPFILIGSSGTLADLRDQGFRTFDGLIDESYDLETDPSRRMHMILAEIDRLSTMPLSALLSNIQQRQAVFDHNYRRCMEIKHALEDKNLDALTLPPCRHLVDYDNVLSTNQLKC